MKSEKSFDLFDGGYTSLDGYLSRLERVLRIEDFRAVEDISVLLFVGGPSGRAKDYCRNVIAEGISASADMYNLDLNVSSMDLDAFAKTDGDRFTIDSVSVVAKAKSVLAESGAKVTLLIVSGVADNIFDTIADLCASGFTRSFCVLPEPSTRLWTSIQLAKKKEAVERGMPQSWQAHWDKLGKMTFSQATKTIADDSRFWFSKLQPLFYQTSLIWIDSIIRVNVGWHVDNENSKLIDHRVVS